LRVLRLLRYLCAGRDKGFHRDSGTAGGYLGHDLADFVAVEPHPHDCVGDSWCASAGNCAAAGYYGGGNNLGPLVVSENNGSWGKAVEVPGSGALNVGGFAQVISVSCTSAGYCAAAGY
jgi:hypothetical protein